MPIEGRSPGQALRSFAEHLNSVLARTVTQTPLVQATTDRGMQLAFRQAGRPIEAVLTTRFGRMGLYLGQLCDAEAIGSGRYQLLTIGYAYTLGVLGADEPLLRWEYVREPDDPEAQWCRHHLQGTPPVDLGPERLTLNDFHAPTGWVTVEEILRFCIVDLGVEPLSEDWDRILAVSYERFKREFAPRGSI